MATMCRLVVYIPTQISPFPSQLDSSMCRYTTQRSGTRFSQVRKEGKVREGAFRLDPPFPFERSTDRPTSRSFTKRLTPTKGNVSARREYHRQPMARSSYTCVRIYTHIRIYSYAAVCTCVRTNGGRSVVQPHVCTLYICIPCTRRMYTA